MLIVVQGFETSRYLGSAYSPTIRIRTMNIAQLISGAIYLLFISLVMILFEGLGLGPIKETAIIGISAKLTPILPVLLVIAATMSQFSAAVADTIASGGLTVETTGGRVTLKYSFSIIVLIAIFLTWLTNIFEIITLASRAFALYYFLQTLTAIFSAKYNAEEHYYKWRLGFFSFVALMMAAVVIFGIPAQ